jgi:hypothetical protein
MVLNAHREAVKDRKYLTDSEKGRKDRRFRSKLIRYKLVYPQMPAYDYDTHKFTRVSCAGCKLLLQEYYAQPGKKADDSRMIRVWLPYLHRYAPKKVN